MRHCCMIASLQKDEKKCLSNFQLRLSDVRPGFHMLSWVHMSKILCDLSLWMVTDNDSPIIEIWESGFIKEHCWPTKRTYSNRYFVKHVGFDVGLIQRNITFAYQNYVLLLILIWRNIQLISHCMSENNSSHIIQFNSIPKLSTMFL